MSNNKPWRNRIVATGEENPDQLLANPKNWRVHPKSQQDAMAGVLDEVGWVQDVIVNRATGMLVDGHLRVSLALRRGESAIPVTYVDLTEAEEALVLATFDPISAMAAADAEMLRNLLHDVSTGDAALQAMIAELAEDSGVLNIGTEEAPDTEVPEPPAQPVTKRGDIWVLGDHRLMCGDATSMDDVARLMAGERAAVFMTDPPYGVDYSEVSKGRANQRAGGWEDIENDDRTGEDLRAFLSSAFAAARTALRDNAAWFCWHPPGENSHEFRVALSQNDVLVHKTIIWAKPQLVFGRWEYHWQHEPCFYGWVHGNHPEFYGSRSETTVWNVEHDGGNKNRNGASRDAVGLGEHPTQKPTELWARAIRNHAQVGDAVLDLFAGSGPVILAAEHTKTRGFAMEMSEAYCDVIVRRWETATGRQAARE